MTFPLEFDLLMIGVCTFLQKNKKTKKKERKKECKDMFVSHILLHRFLLLGSSLGLSEIFMSDELRESSLRSFVPWIMTDMYLI